MTTMAKMKRARQENKQIQERAVFFALVLVFFHPQKTCTVFVLEKLSKFDLTILLLVVHTDFKKNVTEI